MPLQVTPMPQSLYQKWQFAVEIQGFDAALFQKCSLPKVEVEEVNFSPAGSLYDQKAAGRVKFGDISLEKGILQDGSDEAARRWLTTICDATLGIGGVPALYLRDFDIVQYDRMGAETRRWRIHGAFIKGLEYDDLEGGATDNQIEKITIACQSFE